MYARIVFGDFGKSIFRDRMAMRISFDVVSTLNERQSLAVNLSTALTELSSSGPKNG